jgi:adenine-specific DNA-methyltransferase
MRLLATKPTDPALPRLTQVLSEGIGMHVGGNMLIHGDNLPALEALFATHAEKIQCIYIDPPYNTGNAFAHYNDGLRHNDWLSMMSLRLNAMLPLLRPGGYFFCSIDEHEMAYLKVLCDTIFGRANFIGTLVWEKKRKPSFLSHLGHVTEYILVYTRDRASAKPLYHGTTTKGKKYPINNAGNTVRVLTFAAGSVQFGLEDQDFEPCDMSGGNIITRLLDRVQIRSGKNVGEFRLEGEWRYSQAKLNEIMAAGEPISINKAPFRPNHIRMGGAPKKMKNLLSTAHYGLPTYEDATAESRKLFAEGGFDYPKPEKLIHTLISACTKPGDWVLDAFVGSGTTAAVAHKSGRKWIGIESGAHCQSHAADRLRRICRGEELGGITAETGWKGGGGFSFFKVENE